MTGDPPYFFLVPAFLLPLMLNSMDTIYATLEFQNLPSNLKPQKKSFILYGTDKPVKKKDPSEKPKSDLLSLLLQSLFVEQLFCLRGN